MYFIYDLFFNPRNQTLWTGVQAIAAILAAVGAFIAYLLIRAQLQEAHRQTETIRATTGWDLLLRMEERFDSERMQHMRGEAALALSYATQEIIERRTIQPADFWKKHHGSGRRVQHVLDIFETLGLLVRRGAVDEKGAWSCFSYWIVNYHFHCTATGWFDEWAGANDDATIYEDFEWLHARMQQIEAEKPAQDFFKDELALQREL